MFREMTFLMAVVVAFFVASPTGAKAASKTKDRSKKDDRVPTYLIPGESDVLTRAAAAGTWDGEFGMQFRTEEHDGDEYTVNGEPENSASAGWGYLEMSWLSGPVYGTQLGLGGLAVTEMWEKNGFDKNNDVFDQGGTFSDQATWTQAYLKHNVSDETYLVLGRAEDDVFGEPAAGDGDYYQGVGFTTKNIPRVTLRGHAVNEWLNNASASWDWDGIESEWAEMDHASLEVGEDVGGRVHEFGSFAYTLMADIEAIKDVLTISPYVQHHSDVATSLGASFEAEQAVSSAVSVGVDGAWVTHLEDTPDSLWPDDEDFSQRLIRAYTDIKGLKLGLGYYSISNDRVIFNGNAGSGQFEKDFKDVFIMDEMDPMEEDIGKYGEQQGNATIFADAGYSYGPVSLNVVYGMADGAVTQVAGKQTDEGEGTELDVTLGIDIAKNLNAELIYANVQDEFGGDGEQGFDMFGGAVSYSF